MLNKNLGTIFHICSSKNSSEFAFSIIQSSFSCEQFHHFTNSHSRREAVWIHNHIRIDSSICKGHILLTSNQTNYTLLTMARREFIT